MQRTAFSFPSFFTILILLLGTFCQEGCSLYHNFIWYEPNLLDDNGKVIPPESTFEGNPESLNTDYEIWDYYTKTTANSWLIFFIPFIPLGEDYQGPHPDRHTGDFVIWAKKGEECPVVYANDDLFYGKILENEPEDIVGDNNHYDLCHYGKLPIDKQQVYTIKHKGEEKRYLFVKRQWWGYHPFWYPDA